MSNESVTKDEKAKPQKSRYDQMMDNFPILYGHRKLPMTQTCMCWGIECGEGWYYPIQELSETLEAINVVFGKQYGFAITAEQVKEKYGTLRFYHMILPVYPLWRRILASPWKWLAGKYVQGIYPVMEKDAERISWCPKVTNFLYRTFDSIGDRILGSNAKFDCVRFAVDSIVNRLVSEAERKCQDLCEICGHQIGENWAPRCQTLGWISYICEDCAKKHKVRYVIDVTPQEKSFFLARGAKYDKEIVKRIGKVYEDGKDITEEFEAEQKKREEEYSKWLKEQEKKSQVKSAEPKKTPRKGKSNGKAKGKGV